MLVELKPPPQRLFEDSAPRVGRANYLRFRLSPDAAIALAARVKRQGEEFVGDQRELYLLDAQPDEEAPYERLLGDAMAGDGALFTREDAVEAAWAVVDPVLADHRRAHPYETGHLGTEAGRRAHRPRRRLAQPCPRSRRGGATVRVASDTRTDRFAATARTSTCSRPSVKTGSVRDRSDQPRARHTES